MKWGGYDSDEGSDGHDDDNADDDGDADDDDELWNADDVVDGGAIPTAQDHMVAPAASEQATPVPTGLFVAQSSSSLATSNPFAALAAPAVTGGSGAMFDFGAQPSLVAGISNPFAAPSALAAAAGSSASAPAPGFQFGGLKYTPSPPLLNYAFDFDVFCRAKRSSSGKRP